MNLDRFGRWRLHVVAGASLLVAVGVVAVILLVGRAPAALNGSPSPTARSSDDSSLDADTPEAAVRGFFDAFAEARETDDPSIIEDFVNGTDSSAYQTAAGFLLGQREAGKASVVTVQELSNFAVDVTADSATVSFTLIEGGYDVDLESGDPLESPMTLPAENVRAELVRVDDRWLLERYGATGE